MTTLPRNCRMKPVEYRGFIIERVKCFNTGRLHLNPWMYEFKSKERKETGRRPNISECKGVIDSILGRP